MTSTTSDLTHTAPATAAKTAIAPLSPSTPVAKLFAALPEVVLELAPVAPPLLLPLCTDVGVAFVLADAVAAPGTTSPSATSVSVTGTYVGEVVYDALIVLPEATVIAAHTALVLSVISHATVVVSVAWGCCDHVTVEGPSVNIQFVLKGHWSPMPLAQARV